jgi:hypothetical protein
MPIEQGQEPSTCGDLVLQEITEPDGRKIVQVHEVQYLADGPLARLLTRLGLSSQASG